MAQVMADFAAPSPLLGRCRYAPQIQGNGITWNVIDSMSLIAEWWFYRARFDLEKYETITSKMI
jgi:hypothetical protein